MKNIISLIVSVALLICAFVWPTSTLAGEGGLGAGAKEIGTPEEFSEVYRFVFSHLSSDGLTEKIASPDLGDIENLYLTDDFSERVYDRSSGRETRTSRRIEAYISESERLYNISGSVTMSKSGQSGSQSSASIDSLDYDFDIYVDESNSAIRINHLSSSSLSSVNSELIEVWIFFPADCINDLMLLTDYGTVDGFEYMEDHSERFAAGDCTPGASSQTYTLSDMYYVENDVTTTLDLSSASSPSMNINVYSVALEESVEMLEVIRFSEIDIAEIDEKIKEDRYYDNFYGFIIDLGGGY